jgi:hypothetical protein
VRWLILGRAVLVFIAGSAASPSPPLLPLEVPVAAEVLRETIVKRLRQWQRLYAALLLRKAGVIRFRVGDLPLL